MAKNASMLGQTELLDVEAAVAFALEQGAERITLMGWSKGGGIALRVAEQSAHRGQISDLILVGPVTNWAEVIAFGAEAARVPRWISSVVVAALGWSPFARSIGLPAGLDFNALDWTTRQRLTVPALIIHSSSDEEVPIRLSRQMREVNPDLVTLTEFTGALHTMEWNVDRSRFEGLVTARLLSDPQR
ncbi:alpha/beta hydrolase family protein [Subtercola sp. YIM 133946]|uniref:alpha/beta hydrolase family protein n=1 Tax=Subtercola sp. YIM 133946 TaxID=3118909 RepID=UPI002F927E73